MIGEPPADAGGTIDLLVQRVRPGFDDLPLPRYETSGSAGMDLRAAVEELVIAPGDRARVPTGIAIAIPAGFEGGVRPRSGFAWRSGVTVLNSPGTIDSDYRGEVQVILINLGTEPVSIRRGERIAQLLVTPVRRAVLREVNTLPDSDRSGGGFGSTGS